MKKFNKKAILFLCLLLFSISIFASINLNIFCKHSKATETSKITYAKANENCILYKTNSMSNDINNIYFYIPPTYFVAILSNFNNEIYRVQYLNFTGFCYSSCLDKVSFTPTNPYLTNVSFSINSFSGTQVWSLPSDTKGIKFTTISANTTGIEYIASVNGDIPIGGNSNVWYYARFTPATNTTSVYEGYIYSEAVVNLSNIPSNLEVEDLPEQHSPNTITINGPLKIILIILICLPFIILFIVSLIKALNQINNKKKLTKETQTATTPMVSANNINFIKKPKTKLKSIYEDKNPNVETLEVVFPEYDYIDDDDLL